MKINLILFVLFFPVLLMSQSLRDSKQRIITISKESVINNEANLFTFSLDFKHETPFHCASVAWTENHKREIPISHFLFSFSKDSVKWTPWESLFSDEHAIDIRDQFATNLLFFEKEYQFVRVQVVDGKGKVSQNVSELKINFHKK